MHHTPKRLPNDGFLVTMVESDPRGEMDIDPPRRHVFFHLDKNGKWGFTEAPEKATQFATIREAIESIKQYRETYGDWSRAIFPIGFMPTHAAQLAPLYARGTNASLYASPETVRAANTGRPARPDL